MPTSDDAALSLQKVRDGANALNREVVKAVSREFDWYGELSKQDRTYVDLVIRAGINSFVQWFATRDKNGENTPAGVREMFDAAPVELTKTISLKQTLELTRVIVSVIEQQAAAIAVPGQEREVREAILQFSRDVAFSAAEVYAQAAELRGAWDARLQAQALEALIEGQPPEKLIAHFRALSWNTKAPVTVLIGSPPPEFSETAMIALRRRLAAVTGNALVGLFGDQLVLIYCAATDDAAAANRGRKPKLGLPVATASGRNNTAPLVVRPGGLLERASKGYVSGITAATNANGTAIRRPSALQLPSGAPTPPAELLELFGLGPLVIGPVSPTIADAATSVAAALSAWRAARGWTGAPRPVLAADLLPERALLGDHAAQAALVNEVYDPISKGKGLLPTLNAYLENGRSLEAAARDLDIHVNTARYRLNNIAELTGWDPLNPREAYVPQTALTLGALGL